MVCTYGLRNATSFPLLHRNHYMARLPTFLDGEIFFRGYFVVFLSSGTAGGANSPGMLISGRTIQGTGAAGLYALSDIIICELVPPRFRGPYLTSALSTAGIGSKIGPVIGDAMAESNWR